MAYNFTYSSYLRGPEGSTGPIKEICSTEVEKTSCGPRNGSESYEEPPGHLHSLEGDDEDGEGVDPTRML